jgi:nicotinate-nucleotide pyrophosphorylase (carboxylating)
MTTSSTKLARNVIDQVLAVAFQEDLGSGDLTTSACIRDSVSVSAQLRVRDAGIVAGLHVFSAALHFLDDTVDVELVNSDGSSVLPGDIVARVSGQAASILSAERVALNLLQRMSGIATATSQFVEAIAGTTARILDTRKTVPGLRALDKYSVVMGGGLNHRFGLFDAVLIKDNHIRAAGSLDKAVNRARQEISTNQLRLQVECDTLGQVRQCLGLGVGWILLDNMPVSMLSAAVVQVQGRAKLEASGGVTLSGVGEIAATGVDYISIGSLTHSVTALDIGLDFE